MHPFKASVGNFGNTEGSQVNVLKPMAQPTGSYNLDNQDGMRLSINAQAPIGQNLT